MNITVTAVNNNVIEDTEIDITNTFEPDPKTGYRLKTLPFEVDVQEGKMQITRIKGDLLGQLYQFFKS